MVSAFGDAPARVASATVRLNESMARIAERCQPADLWIQHERLQRFDRGRHAAGTGKSYERCGGARAEFSSAQLNVRLLFNIIHIIRNSIDVKESGEKLIT